MSDVEEIKSRLSIVDIIGSRVKLAKAGRNFKGLCPFHNEKSPSFMVSPDRQLFHCFGCGKGGTIFDFVMYSEQVDFREALDILAEQAGVTLSQSSAQTPEDKKKERIFVINKLASEYYGYLLKKHPIGEKARLYLKERGVSEKIIDTFGLGYSPNSWDGLCSYLRKKKYDSADIVDSGLALYSQRGNSCYDRFRGRVMFTLRDHRGNVVGFSGRLLEKDVKEAKYINTSETPVYSKSNVLYGLDVTKSAISEAKSAIIMEGEFDVLSSFAAGISNVVAIKGSALTEGHVRLLRRYTDTLIFALDSDIAGDMASRRGIELADKAGFDMKVVAISSGKDPDEAVREHPHEFAEAVKKAIPIYDYLLQSAFRRHDKKTAVGKKKIADEVLGVYAKIENSIVQAHYVKLLAKELETSEDSVYDMIRKISRGLAQSVEQAVKKQPSEDPIRSRVEKMEFYLLGLLLLGNPKDLYEDLEEYAIPSQIIHPGVKGVLTALGVHIADHSVFLLKDFLDSLPPEITPVADEALLLDTQSLEDDPDLFAKEWQKTIRLYRTVRIRADMQRLSQDTTDESQAKMGELTRQLSAIEKSG